MTSPQHFAVVFEREANGTVSAYLPDLPGVYAAADSLAAARRGIREALEGYLKAMRERGWRLPGGTCREAGLPTVALSVAGGRRRELRGHT